ncbi:hypothetical protein PMIN04_009735 [Paraphaeosphaeria minitans]
MATEFLGQPVYAPLNSSLDEIRLLRLLPGSDEDRLRCTLSIVSLDDRPHYEALSYVWGDDLEDTFPISLGGHTVQIRRNLHSALRGIRYLDCERILWIDALCIDQENVEERHTQVAIMGDIYSKADCVLAYIGEDFDGCDRVMDTMRYISENGRMHFDGSEDMLLRIHGVSVLNGGIPWDLVYKFFETPWITRVWTAQEYVLAESMLVYRSRLSIPRQTLNNFVDYAPRHVMIGCCELRKEHDIVFRDEVFQQWRILHGPPAPNTSILLPLEYYRIRKSTKPHDKVYGMLGLAGDVYKKRIKADDTISIEDLFTNVVRIESEVSGRLDFLSYCRDQNLVLPSWVPDWTFYDQTRESQRYDELYLARYKADGNRPSGAFVPGGRKLLVTIGVQLSTVYRRYGPRAESQLHAGSIAHMWKWTTAHPVSASYYGGMQALEQAFWLTMCGGLDALSRPDEDGFASMPWKYRRLKPVEYAEAMELWKKAVYGESEYGDANMLFGRLTYDRCYVVMESGAIGFAPRDARLGDMMVALRGGSLVYVLRPESYCGWGPRKYMFVGDGYMDGFMDGEAFVSVDEGLDDLRAFTLV